MNFHVHPLGYYEKSIRTNSIPHKSPTKQFWQTEKFPVKTVRSCRCLTLNVHRLAQCRIYFEAAMHVCLFFFLQISIFYAIVTFLNRQFVLLLLLFNNCILRLYIINKELIIYIMNKEFCYI